MMLRPRRVISGGLLAAAITFWPAALFAQDSLSAARELYASAAYEDALAVLSRLNAAGMRPDDGRTADQYRALCLLALGKTAEASQAIAESDDIGRVIFRGANVEKADARANGCGTRGKRPHCRDAAEKRDEVAPSHGHSMISSAAINMVGDTLRSSDLAALRLMTNSNLVGACTGRSLGFSPLRMRST